MLIENFRAMQVLLVTCGAWHLPHTAKAFEQRSALAGLWISFKNSTRLPPEKYRRCWPFHAAMKPFYHLAPQIVAEKTFFALFPLWRAWFQNQPWPACDVVQAITGYATEPFQRARQTGALKVLDSPNSHPLTFQSIWQAECDRWCPGEKIPVPQWMIDRMCREIDAADVVLCPSTFVLETMLQHGVPAKKCFLNHFGVDTSVFKPRPTVPETPRFITSGTICLRKASHYLFRAFEIVKQRLPQAELLVIGGYKADFRRERPRWEGTFTHYKYLSHAGLSQLLTTGTAFVIPSLEEGFARVIPEAMAAGLPIIGTHESGITTVMQHGREGFVVPARDVESLAEAMLKVAENPELGLAMGKAAWQTGAVKNSWQDYGDRLLAEYPRRLNHENCAADNR